MDAFRISVQSDDFHLADELAELRAGRPGVGGIVSFVGTVRDWNLGSGVSAMDLEHYPGMTEKAIAEVAAAAHQRFDVVASRIIHRVGTLQPGEQIVLVAVAAAHRGPAFAACEYMIDYLKTRAPFWKRESTPTGARWVDARSSDEEATARWCKPAT